MRCYYEELGVEREASDADVKTAYRKLALRWHPDKNLDCLEEAKVRFQLIQQAYEVISDPHERAWYDNHREQILRGKHSDYEENCLDLFPYFTSLCFKGYGDDAKGFYSVYREVFEKIAAEDIEFMEDEEDMEKVPNLGDSQSSYEETVGPFYAYWQAYCTKKTYEWLCPHNIQEIRDRRILREIDKDMKKVVQKAKKERNEEVRNLVAFVRKRDKRVQAYKLVLEERAALNRKKQEQNRIDKLRKRHSELEQIRKNPNIVYNEGYEEQLKQLEQEYDSDSSGDNDSLNKGAGDDSAQNVLDVDDYVNELYCTACNKAFKNEKAFANHELSKKHRECVEIMKQEMLADEDMFQDNGTDSGQDSNESLEIATDEETRINELVINSDNDDTNYKKKNKKNKKVKKRSQIQSTSSEIDTASNEQNFITPANVDNSSDLDDWQKNSAKKNARKSKAKKNIKKSNVSKIETIGGNEFPANITNESIESNSATFAATNGETLTCSSDFKCATCSTSFKSKNKLFAHLKTTNHSVYLPKPNETVDNAKNKSKGKRK